MPFSQYLPNVFIMLLQDFIYVNETNDCDLFCVKFYEMCLNSVYCLSALQKHNSFDFGNITNV